MFVHYYVWHNNETEYFDLLLITRNDLVKFLYKTAHLTRLCFRIRHVIGTVLL